jgi:16S rRNA (cytidine1402-2'-O)-methyltransferase
VLYIVGTPIGNLGDISQRAIKVLSEVDLIAAEDTRHTLRLLNALGLKKSLVSIHEHNEAMRTVDLVSRLKEGLNIALVSDAGMPIVSDPGMRLVNACAEQGLAYQIVPGPSAVTSAIAGSGFPGDCFHFGGFLSVKQGRRRRELSEGVARDVTTAFFESPHRILRTLEILAEISPERVVCVCREITKIHEEFRRGLPEVLIAHYTDHPARGEIVLVISPGPKRPRSGCALSEEEPNDEDPTN